jgi:hypothetical protein
VHELGGRAWHFVSTRSAEHFTEFVEWQSAGEAPIIERETIAAAIRQLHTAFPSEESDTWTEAGL